MHGGFKTQTIQAEVNGEAAQDALPENHPMRLRYRAISELTTALNFAEAGDWAKAHSYALYASGLLEEIKFNDPQVI